MNVSVLSYSFRGLLGSGEMDVFGYLEACRHRYGLSLADIWNGFLESVDAEYLRKIRNALDERELGLADLCVDQAHIWDDDEAARAKNYENALAHLTAADILGARFVRIDAGSRDDAWTEEQFDHIVTRYKEYAAFAHDHGFKVGIENHWGPERGWANLKRVHDAVDHPGFGVSCHFGGWSGSDEEVAQADRDVAAIVSHTHIAWDVCQGDVAATLKPLWDAGYEGAYSVEHHSGTDEYTEVATQIAQVRDALDKLRRGTDA
jgi:sugar phosphate isomerase/epimerase